MAFVNEAERESSIMKLTERQIGDATVLEMRGALAGTRAVEALDAAVHRLCRLGASSVVVDMSRVPSVDLEGLGALVDAHRVFGRAGARFSLAGITKRLHDLVVITRLLTVFDTYESVEGAVGSADMPTASGASAVSPMSLSVIQRFLRRA